MRTFFGTSVPQLAAAFTEWERRWREEPEKFQSEMERLAATSETYGEAAAAYLMKVWSEQREKDVKEQRAKFISQKICSDVVRYDGGKFCNAATEDRFLEWLRQQEDSDWKKQMLKQWGIQNDE